eukprot:1366453-Amphidinium_carterae.1
MHAITTCSCSKGIEVTSAERTFPPATSSPRGRLLGRLLFALSAAYPEALLAAARTRHQPVPARETQSKPNQKKQPQRKRHARDASKQVIGVSIGDTEEAALF